MKEFSLENLLSAWGGAVDDGGCCDHCGRAAQVYRFLEKEPAVLVLVIGRRQEGKGKRSCAVSFPQELACMRSGGYALASVLQHEGDKGDEGHFVATCSVGPGRYVVCDDDRVTLKTWAEIATPALW